MREIQSRLVGVINETRVRGEAMAALIEQYLNVKTYYPFRPIGNDPSIRYPHISVDPRSQEPDLASTGKYHLRLDYYIRWYAFDNSAEDLADLISSIGENLVKLFSNNALNDLGTASPPSHNFCAYDPFWINVVQFPWQQTPILLNVIPGHDEKYMRVGRMPIQIETWVIK